MKINIHAIVTLALGFITLVSASANASVYEINNQASGYISVGGNFTGISPNTNYLVGLCNASNCQSAPGEYRDFFYFDIPALDGPIASVSLNLPTQGVTLNQTRTLTYQVTSLDIPSTSLANANFDQLGNGTNFGSREYSDADLNLTRSIAMNNNAIAALGAG